MIAVGSSKSIYVYKCSSNNQLKKIHVYRGHSSSIVSLDWCGNSVYVQSNDQAKEILYWNVTTGTQVTKTTAMRDVDWHTWTCLYGWPVRGVYHPEISDNNNDVISVCRTRSGQHMITSDSMNRSSGDIQLFTFPALPSKYHLSKRYAGHCSLVTALDVSSTDSHVYTTNGTTIMQWTVKCEGKEEKDTEGGGGFENKKTRREKEYAQISSKIKVIAPSSSANHVWPGKQRVVVKTTIVSEEEENDFIDILARTVADLVDAVVAIAVEEKNARTHAEPIQPIQGVVAGVKDVLAAPFESVGLVEVLAFPAEDSALPTPALPPIDTKSLGTFKEKIFHNWSSSDNEAWLASLETSLKNRNALEQSNKSEFIAALKVLTERAPKITAVVEECSLACGSIVEFWNRFVADFHCQFGVVVVDEKGGKGPGKGAATNATNATNAVTLVNDMNPTNDSNVVNDDSQESEAAATRDFILSALKCVLGTDQADATQDAAMLKGGKEPAVAVEKDQTKTTTPPEIKPTLSTIDPTAKPVATVLPAAAPSSQQHNAAVKIQSMQRGKRDRHNLQQQHQQHQHQQHHRRHKAAIAIQKVHRGRRTRRKQMYRKRYPPSQHRHEAATKIQSIHRGRRVRVQFILGGKKKPLHQRAVPTKLNGAPYVRGGGSGKTGFVDPLLGHGKSSIV